MAEKEQKGNVEVKESIFIIVLILSLVGVIALMGFAVANMELPQPPIQKNYTVQTTKDFKSEFNTIYNWCANQCDTINTTINKGQKDSATVQMTAQFNGVCICPL